MTWVHVPLATDCRSQPEPVAWIWASCSPSRGSRRDAGWNGMGNRENGSSPPSAPDISRQRRSGMTCERSMGNRCEARSMRSLPDTPASHLAPPASALAKATSATCGPISPGSSQRSGRDGCSSKTSQAMLASVQRPFCATYEEWASLLRLACSRREKSVRRTSGSDGFAWPTPMAGTPAQNGNSAEGNSDFTRRAEELASAMLMTPRASDGEKGGPNQSFGAGGTPLPAMAANWPTPAARDYKGENSPDHLDNGTGRLHLDQLPNAVAFLFSRPCPQTPQDGQPSSITRQISRRLLRRAISSIPQTTMRRWSRQGRWRKRRLNPAFVEWLMGWPEGHALCASSETAWFHWRRHMLGALSQLPMACGPWIWEPRNDPSTEQMEMAL